MEAGHIFRGLKGIIFDLDGTLYDQRGLALRLIAANPRYMVLIRKERMVRKLLSGRDMESPERFFLLFFASLARLSGKPESFLRSWYFNRYIPLMCSILKRYYVPRPGTDELFGLLKKAAFPFAVYSDYPLTAERLAALGLNPELCPCYGPDSFGALKPASRPFRIIAENLGSPCAATLVAGDRAETDGAGAAACGMRYIRIRRRGGTGRGESCPVMNWETFCTTLPAFLQNRS
jgi:FMN phosphatase YigB (HAD superfamily)